jgi:hypothetical protein
MCLRWDIDRGHAVRDCPVHFRTVAKHCNFASRLAVFWLPTGRVPGLYYTFSRERARTLPSDTIISQIPMTHILVVVDRTFNLKGIPAARASVGYTLVTATDRWP